MIIAFKIADDLLARVYEDLQRPHPFAAERVGFLSCRVGALKPAGWVVLAHDFHPVADADYLRDRSVGAMMGPTAIRKALQVALRNEVGMFHVHIHGHRGKPWFSGVDLRETAKFVPDFWHVRPHLVHGAIVLSLDSAAGLCSHPQALKPIVFTKFSVVGAPMRAWRGENERKA
jgi:proteasome lid subunit RPN8/RPN11